MINFNLKKIEFDIRIDCRINGIVRNVHIVNCKHIKLYFYFVVFVVRTLTMYSGLAINFIVQPVVIIKVILSNINEIFISLSIQ